MTAYTYAQLEQLWINAGGPRSVAPVAAAIALAESGGNPLAAYPGTTVAPGHGSTNDATGLWQILGLPSGSFTAAELTDPVWNARMAVAKYEQAGNSFSPWQTYTSGAYTQFLQGSTTPDPNVPTQPGATPSGSSTPGATTTAASTRCLVGGNTFIPCILDASQARGLIGGMCMLAGGVIFGAGVIVIVILAGGPAAAAATPVARTARKLIPSGSKT